MADVSVRTLHFYDEAGLLPPAHVEKNGYRKYGHAELLKLQQILFFRELDFSVEEIKRILNAPGFDMVQALKDHRKLILIRQKRLTTLLKTIDTTIKHMNHKKDVNDTELYAGFSEEQEREYAEEAKKRWGNTDAYKQSVERTKHWTKEDYDRIKKEGHEFMLRVVANRSKGAASPEVQELISEWRAGINRFYDTTLEICRGLAQMYVDDPRFTAYYDKYESGLAVFMRDAIFYYCDHAKK